MGLRSCGAKVLLAATFGLAMSFVASAAWDRGDPVVSYWAGPGYPGHPEKLTERAAKQLKEGGFNLAWAQSREELDVAAKYGLRAIYCMGASVRYLKKDGVLEDPELESRIRAVKDHPALYVYSHYDEPSAKIFKELAREKERMRRLDPNHPTWCGLLPSYANSEQLGLEGDVLSIYGEYWRRFCETYRPEVIDFDYYPFCVDLDYPHYFLNLGLARQHATLLGVPFKNSLQACTWWPEKSLASPAAPRVPGPAELRYLVYTSIAYGADAISYYVYSFPGHTGTIMGLDGKPGPNFETVKALNGIFVAMTRELRDYRFSAAYFQGAQTLGTTPYCEAAVLRLEPATADYDLPQGKHMADTTLVSRFEAADGRQAFVVVNLDYRKVRRQDVTAPYGLERYDPIGKRWVPVGSRFALELDKGEGVLLRQADGSDGTPNLRFGVVSDIHFVYDTQGIVPGYGPETFEKTLRWLDGQGVDAVLVCGDLADRSLCEEWQSVADAWFRVFPNDRGADGRKVERIFITGNHDWAGHLYGTNVKRIFPDEAERAKHVMRNDIPGWWKKVFHEDYRTVFRKDVKGYAFIGHHWEGGNWEASGFKGLEPFLKSDGGKGLDDPSKPFFYLQHAPLRGTCNGDDALPDSDSGESTKCLSAYPNAVAFSGHSHYPLTDERAIWQGAFTSVGVSSLRYSSLYTSANCENTGSRVKDAAKVNDAKMMRDICPDPGTQQGLLVSVYDDRIVYRRRDFRSDQSLGPDWIQPLPASRAKPFDFAEHARQFRAPQFAAGAQLALKATKGKNRAGVEKDAVQVDIPPVVADPQARVFTFRIEISSDTGGTVTKHVAAKGFNRSLEHVDASAVTSCPLAFDVLPAGRLTFSVTPVNCFGEAGRPLQKEYGKRL